MGNTIKDEFIEAINQVKDVFISIYNSIVSFFAKYLGEDIATLALVAIAFLILMLVVNKLINK